MATAAAPGVPHGTDRDTVAVNGSLGSKLETTLKLKEPPVEGYADMGKVPVEFVHTDEKNIPNRNWGDDDESKPKFVYPTINLAPLMRFFSDQQLPGDEEASGKIIEDMGKACEEWGFFQVGTLDTVIF